MNGNGSYFFNQNQLLTIYIDLTIAVASLIIPTINYLNIFDKRDYQKKKQTVKMD